MNQEVFNIPGGEAGTDATIKTMEKFFRESLYRGQIRREAIQITKGSDSKNESALIQSIFDYIKSNVRYVNDPLDLETVQRPEITLNFGAGDCDDQALLFAALVGSLGIPVRLVTIGPSRRHFVHIYPQAFVRNRWISADTTLDEPLGFTPEHGTKKIYNLNLEDKNMPALNGAPITLPYTRGQMKTAVYKAVYDTVATNYSSGRIGMNDIDQYLEIWKNGNSPYRGNFLDGSIIQAIRDVKKDIFSTNKPIQKSGLGGLDGFLGSIVSAVTGVVTGAIGVVANIGKKIIGGDSGGQTVVEIQTSQPTTGPQQDVAYTTPQNTRGEKSITDYLPWIGLGLISVFIIPKMMR